jgi:uncharacterized membrane protein
MEDILQKKEDDLPKSIIVILVVLAVAISVLGTFTVLNELNRIDRASVYKGNPAQTAKISFTVVDPEKSMSHTTGQIMFRVQKPGEN